METKLTLGKGWCKFWKFIAGILQDQGDGASSKRVVLLVLLAIFAYQNIVYFNVPASQVNMQFYYSNLAALITFGGYVVSEFFKPLTDAGLLKTPPKEIAP